MKAVKAKLGEGETQAASSGSVAAEQMAVHMEAA